MRRLVQVHQCITGGAMSVIVIIIENGNSNRVQILDEAVCVPLWVNAVFYLPTRGK